MKVDERGSTANAREFLLCALNPLGASDITSCSALCLTMRCATLPPSMPFTTFSVVCIISVDARLPVEKVDKPSPGTTAIRHALKHPTPVLLPNRRGVMANTSCLISVMPNSSITRSD